MLTPYNGTAFLIPNHEMAISPIFRYLLYFKLDATFLKLFRLTKKNYDDVYRELPPDGALKYSEKAIYDDVPVAPVGITLLSG